MANTPTMEQLTAAEGTTVYDASGDKIGSVEEIFYDEQTRQPEWIGVGTGFFGTKRVLVPVEGARISGDEVRVRYTKDQVKDSPDVDSDEISEALERDLYSHYGLQPSTRESDTVLPEGRTGDSGSGTVTRSEEELDVGKRDVDRGRARVRKWVETEPVDMNVDLRQETARVTRERIDQPVSGAEIGEDEVEVELRGEEPMVQKRTVAKERVGLEKDVDVETATVRDEVRKERVDVEGDVERR